MHLDIRARVAAHWLDAGGIVAYPTEGVWGLGCDPNNPEAVQRLQQLKGRTPEKSFLLVAANTDQVAGLLSALSPVQRQTLAAEWPGPLTWIIPDPERRVPPWVKGVNDSIAVRVSAHPVVVALCRAFGGPIVSTSANRSSRPPLRHPWQLRRELGEGIDYLFGGELGGAKGATEIRDLISGRVVRPRGA